MQKNSLHSQFLVVMTLLAASTTVSLYGQSRSLWVTSADIRNGARGSIVGEVASVDTARSRFEIVADAETADSKISVSADSLVTRYIGFGTGATASDPMTGTSGFTQIRVRDRVEVRGIGAANAAISADEVRLLGRAVMDNATTAVRRGKIEGIVRQANADENRLVIESDNREMYTVIGTASTPVYYRGATYRLRNIEVGDRIRVEPESSSADGLRARLIDVISSVSEGTTDKGRTVTTLGGRVIRVDARAQTFRMESERGREIRVDAQSATDGSGRRFRITDLKAGDRVDMTGNYDGTDLFLAGTIRFALRDVEPLPGRDADDELDRDDEVVRDDDDDDDEEDEDELDDDDRRRGLTTLVIYGVVEESLRNSDMLVIRDTSSKKLISLHVSDELITRLREGGYGTAGSLKDGDRVVVTAFRDEDGRHIAQTIRTR